MSAPPSTEELFWIIYCIVDDLYREAASDRGPVPQRSRSNEGNRLGNHYFSIMQEARANDSEVSFLVMPQEYDS